MNAAGEQLKPRVFCVPNLRNRARAFPTWDCSWSPAVRLWRIGRKLAPPSVAWWKSTTFRRTCRSSWAAPRCAVISPPTALCLSPTTATSCCWVVTRGASRSGGNSSASAATMPRPSSLWRAARAARKGLPHASPSFWNACCYTRRRSPGPRTSLLPCLVCTRCAGAGGRTGEPSRFRRTAQRVAGSAGTSVRRTEGRAPVPQHAGADACSTVCSAPGWRWRSTARRTSIGAPPAGAYTFRSSIRCSSALPRRNTLKPLGLEEPLSWAAAALNRVDRDAFLHPLRRGRGCPLFLRAVPGRVRSRVRTQFGVWYTPREIVRYMVERVDRVLRSELGVADGLADPSVWILDPCCGTGAYLVEVLA